MRHDKFSLAAKIVVALFILSMGGWFMFAIQITRTQSSLAKCSSNLKDVAAALIVYSDAHGGHYPVGLGEVLRQGRTPYILICPASHDSVAIGTLQEQIADVAAGKHCSYIYLGKGLMTSAPPDTVLAYDQPGHHPDGQMTVLFADYHTAVLDSVDARALVKAVVPGQPLIRPPRIGPAR